MLLHPTEMCIRDRTITGPYLNIQYPVVTENNGEKKVSIQNLILFPDELLINGQLTVSYTHLDVYKRQALGCTKKCGKSYVAGVRPYGERLQKKGLNLLSAPGNDLVAATTLAACGCHMVCLLYTSIDSKNGNPPGFRSAQHHQQALYRG